MTSNKKEEFSRQFMGLLVREGVSERARPYYMRHLERWGAAMRRRPAGMGRKDFLEGYLKELVHTKGVAAFVAHQTADAVRLAHEVLLAEDWAKEVDWEGLRAEYREDPNEEPGEVVLETLDKLREGWVAAGFSGAKVESLARMVRVMREGNYALRVQ